QQILPLLAVVSQIGPISAHTDTTATNASLTPRPLGDFNTSLIRDEPEFDDMLLGRLIVSKENYPLLTPKDAPESAHIYPTDQQLAVIKAAAGGERQFMNRVSGDGNIDWEYWLAKFLEGEFTYEVLNSTVVDYGSLPFDQLDAGRYFKMVIVEENRGEVFLRKLFAQLQNLSTTTVPWLPAQTLVTEMDMCLEVLYSRSSNKDFKFDLNTGGKMVYYNVICERKDDLSRVISISVYDSEFKFKHIEHEERIAKSWQFFWFNYTQEKIHRWFEPRHITLEDWKTLEAYMMSDFAANLRHEYRQILAKGGVPVHDD
ncbi:hypothetical protein PENTCL1PPCAC_10030, partial [Pristionchus entomophagus]